MQGPGVERPWLTAHPPCKGVFCGRAIEAPDAGIGKRDQRFPFRVRPDRGSDRRDQSEPDMTCFWCSKQRSGSIGGTKNRRRNEGRRSNRSDGRACRRILKPPARSNYFSGPPFSARPRNRCGRRKPLSLPLYQSGAAPVETSQVFGRLFSS